jgi:hypothetical protein
MNATSKNTRSTDPRLMAPSSTVPRVGASPGEDESVQPSTTSGAAMQTQQERTGWASWAMFAGLMMILVGIFQQIQGLVAIFNDDWYQVTNKGLTLSFDYTVWGWIHFVLGLVIATAGVAVFNGKTWARILGCVLAIVSAVLNLMFIAAYPAWSIIVITLDVIVIYALSMHGDELRRA